MMPHLARLSHEKSSFVLIGEGGSGKSELAIALARELAKRGEKPVHFFDLDMTKPLFRSRDVTQELEMAGIHVHFAEQFMDAPTVSGGVSRLLREENCYVVMDVGGDFIGARAIGGYAPLLNRAATAVYYVINPFRPWSMDMEHIDQVLEQILSVSHLSVENLHLIGNPNLGIHTTPADVEAGARQLLETVGTCAAIEFLCVREELSNQVTVSLPVLPIRLHLTYPWNQGIADVAG